MIDAPIALSRSAPPRARLGRGYRFVTVTRFSRQNESLPGDARWAGHLVLIDFGNLSLNYLLVFAVLATALGALPLPAVHRVIRSFVVRGRGQAVETGSPPEGRNCSPVPSLKRSPYAT